MSNSFGPIGFFDSGVGGTSVWSAVNNLLPNESTIYVADSANAPYGERSAETILALSIKNTDFLISKGCKLIVVACNTATTNAIAVLREKYTIPFIGIEPAIKPAALQTLTGKVGLLATKGTLGSALFHKTVLENAGGVEIIEQEGTGLVALIEGGFADGEEVAELLKSYLLPMQEKGIDRLVLGCTHYPYLIPAIKKILSSRIEIIDAAGAVAKQTKKVLEKEGLLVRETVTEELTANDLISKAASYEFYSNGATDVLKSFMPSCPRMTLYYSTDF
jgi:glutamate racemase